MRVLGIDPGYDRLGIAVVDGPRERPTLVHSSCVVTDRDAAFSVRIKGACDAVRAAVRSHAPDAIALEEIFFSKNQRTAMRVAHVRGALMLVAEEEGVPIAEYNPSAIKIAITGEGRSEKAQMMSMLPKLIRLSPVQRLDDEFDAIAVAITHLASTRISPLRA